MKARGRLIATGFPGGPEKGMAMRLKTPALLVLACSLAAASPIQWSDIQAVLSPSARTKIEAAVQATAARLFSSAGRGDV